MNKQNIHAISLFSGCGGLDIGAHNAGASIIAAIEIDNDSVMTMKANRVFADTQIFNQDIKSFNSKILKALLKKRKSDKFIIIGGPPCQPFSKAGYWIGNSRRKIESDPRNLFSQFTRLVRELRPDGFLLENVESLLHPTNRPTVESLEKEIIELGYNFKLIRAFALDYGIPQKRRRVFFVGNKKKFKTEVPPKTHGDVKDSKNKSLLPYENVGKFIKEFDDQKHFESQEVISGGTYENELKNVPPGKNYMSLSNGNNLPKFKSGSRFWTFLLKLHPDKPSWTIAAQPGPWTGPFHWSSRRLRIPEIAAIQTFPKNYRFYGSRRSIQSQIGNAVPPILGKTFVSFLINNL